MARIVNYRFDIWEFTPYEQFLENTPNIREYIDVFSISIVQL